MAPTSMERKSTRADTMSFGKENNQEVSFLPPVEKRLDFFNTSPCLHAYSCIDVYVYLGIQGCA